MRATAEVSKAAANLDDPTPHTQGSVLYLCISVSVQTYTHGSVLYLPSIKRAASSVALVSNEVGPLPSCQLVSLKLPYIHTSLPLPFTISTKYNICHIRIGKNHHPIGGRLICEWEYR